MHFMKAFKPDRERFYLLCNTESEAERSGRICGGGWDPPLTRDGMNHLRRLSRRLKGNPLGIRTLVCSPLLRSVQAADIIHDILRVRMIALSALNDRNLGVWEKQKMRDVTDFDRDAPRIPEGEDHAVFISRISAGLASALAQSAEILIVSQLAVADAVCALLLIPPPRFEPGVIYHLSRTSQNSQEWNIQNRLSVK